MAVVVSNLPDQGPLVTVRSRQWAVNEVQPSTLTTSALKPTFVGPQTLLALLSVEDVGLGEDLQVVWEIEPGARVIENVAMVVSFQCQPDRFCVHDQMELGLLVMRRPLPGTWKSSWGG